MKKFNSTICSLSLLLLCLFTPQLLMRSSAHDVLLHKDNSTPPQPGRNYAPSAFVTTTGVTLDDSVLTVDFGYPTGTVTVVVYDESNQIVFTETVDTLTTPTFSALTDNWDGGTYTITITCADTTLRGDFDL
jgi:hypothetical protein